MRGRYPTPVRLRLLKGNPGRRPLRAGPEPPRPPECPPPPDCVRGYALDTWWTVGPELWRLGLLTTVDRMVFAAFCVAAGRWRTAEESLARLAERGATDAEARVLRRISRAAADAMLRYAGELGCTPRARQRLTGGIGPPPTNKFADLLGGEP
jgi:P27 family predicted phage terminase small subunit